MSLEEPEPKKMKVIAEEAEHHEDPEDTAEVLAQRNDSNEIFFVLSPKRHVTIRKFKGTTLVDIREVRL
jgi:hypothetical protein